MISAISVAVVPRLDGSTYGLVISSISSTTVSPETFAIVPTGETAAETTFVAVFA